MNALARVLGKGDSPADWRNRVQDLQSKRDALAARLQGAVDSRKANAFPAAEGDAEAQKALDRATAREYELQQDLRSQDDAIASARERLAEAEQREREATVAREVAVLRRKAERRLAAAKRAEDALRAFAEAVQEAGDLAAEIRVEVPQLAQRHGLQKPESWAMENLMPGAVAVRLRNTVCALRASSWLDVRAPTFRYDLSADFADGERRAHDAVLDGLPGGRGR
ncbi:MAG: hypothetical protein WD341_01830 [Tistlia sp.]|uniref:hypothetical protein n=1 Tax=Tistlia sp. TaxID=3057121 RepID=UPI0034A5182B